VDVDLQVMVDPECDLSGVASEVSQVVQDVITQQMRVALPGRRDCSSIIRTGRR